ncbi:Na+/H+ antiporter NhaC family protein [Pistricoccus aurantiacus]|uniref:Na+/H+ antiporter NhaC family protein n=1 Tax=Pistricoccus aurantiacus TaxID=1883414 RepID=A0A5B8SV44_9GAMM|nr:Na+/H+ antiporter NhaC family protein [Pistricoccus aurantiacus]QEA38550.1 Na+/H+ antiporter NhaC family protein [Pistricoccus aurantiacus]
MDALISLIPPLTAVLVALTTRRVNLSLFMGIWIGGWLVTGDPISAIGQTFDWFAEVMTDEWNARFLVLTSLLGAGAAFMYKIGGSHAVARWLGSRVSTSKGSLLLTWALGMLIFFNDYVNSVIVGNASRDVTARQRVSREKLAWVLDSTSAPMATLGPVSDWIGYQVSLIAAAFVSISLTTEKPYWVFLQSIPWNFYALLCLASIPMIVLLGDFGPMRKAERRAKESGDLVAPGDTPLLSVEGELGEPHTDEGRLWHFLLPLVALIGVSGWALWYTGGGMQEGKSLMDALADTDVAVSLSWAAFAMTLTGLIIALTQRMSLADCEHTLLSGFRIMLPALVIIVLAWTIGTVTDAMDAGEHIIEATESWLSPALLPILIFAIAMLISFATGSSWGTMAILTPIGVPLAYTMGDIVLVQVAIGAIFSGAIFGDHCSPISDTTVMSSIFAGSDHIAHVRTQIPYAIVPASIAGALYLLSILIESPYLLLGIGALLQLIVIWGLARVSNRTREHQYASDES